MTTQRSVGAWTWPPFVLGALLAALALSVAAPARAWSPTTESPRPVRGPAGMRDLYAACGAPDAALIDVATHLAVRRAKGGPPPAADLLVTQLRAAGAPYLWPRAWALKGGSDIAGSRLARWAEGAPPGPRRCGVARAIDERGRSVLAAVSAAAAADLEPLPRRVRQGQWIALQARLRDVASGAKVVLLGPRGRPRRVLASLSGAGPGQILRSRFTLDQPGRWLVQVVADLEGGPRPVLEALVFADVAPHGGPTEEEASDVDEAAAAKPKDGEADPDAPGNELWARLNRARRSEGMSALRRDPQLDAVARRHAKHMARTGRTAHDVGAGSPRVRAARAGVRARHLGENVASAPTIDRVHRALWNSPSHRENMLDRNFRRVGVAVVRTARGRRYAVQLYAD
ncbi:MAG: CAP domain-containing protein [Myxococcota bacterium]